MGIIPGNAIFTAQPYTVILVQITIIQKCLRLISDQFRMHISQFKLVMLRIIPKNTTFLTNYFCCPYKANSRQSVNPTSCYRLKSCNAWYVCHHNGLSLLESETTYTPVGLFGYGIFSDYSTRLPVLCTYKSAPCLQYN